MLAGCKDAGGEQREDGVPTLTYATLSGQVDREMVDRFNAEHEGEIQIKVEKAFHNSSKFQLNWSPTTSGAPARVRMAKLLKSI